MRFIWDNYFEKTQGAYPFFKYCPKKYHDYYINLLASNCLGYKYNYLEPKTLNEKIRWLIYNEKLGLKTKLSDKILVKSFVASNIGENKSAELYGVYNNFNEIDFSVLPKKFALKANHGWRMNILIDNKDYIFKNINNIKKETNKWLHTNFEEYNLEPQYKKIRKKLFIERLRSDNIYYKKKFDIYCFNSKPLFIEKSFVKSGKTFPIFFNTAGEVQKFTEIDEDILWHKPDELDTMLKYAQILSQGFSFVRIDFAFDNNNIQIEEMTFTPYACKIPFLNKNIDLELGNLIKLPSIKGNGNE